MRKNKKYKIDIPIGYNGTKRIRHIETFYGGKKEAVLRENELKIQLKNNTYVRKNHLIMKDLIDEWLKSKENDLGIKTYKEYERICKNINKYIGHIKVKDINVKILEDFYKDLKTSKGKGTVNYPCKRRKLLCSQRRDPVCRKLCQKSDPSFRGKTDCLLCKNGGTRGTVRRKFFSGTQRIPCELKGSPKLSYGGSGFKEWRRDIDGEE